MEALDAAQIMVDVLRRQHLTPDSKDDDVVQTVKDISGLHAANAATPYLSLLARTRHFAREQLDEELYCAAHVGAYPVHAQGDLHFADRFAGGSALGNAQSECGGLAPVSGISRRASPSV